MKGYDEIFMQQSLHFAESLKDLKNLGKQLYSAAEYFESSYAKKDEDDEQKDDEQKQLVMESSKDYVAKALVSSVDHLGSVAHKLNMLLDEKTRQFSVTILRFSFIQQRFNTWRGFIDRRGVLQHSLILKAPQNHKHYIVPGALTFHLGKSMSMYRNCIPYPQYDLLQTNQDNPFAKGFQAIQTKKPQQTLVRKGWLSDHKSTGNPVNFSFTSMNMISIKKGAGKRPVSPLHFPLKRSGSVANRSVSPTPPWENKRRNSMIFGIPDITNRERESVSFTKRSKHLFKSLLNVHRSKKDIERARW